MDGTCGAAAARRSWPRQCRKAASGDQHPVRRRRRRRPRPAHAARRCCPACARSSSPTFVVVNGENAAGGLGITPQIADELFAAGVDVITLGNHAYHRREILPYLDARATRIVRPANYLRRHPGQRRDGRRARRRAARGRRTSSAPSSSRPRARRSTRSRRVLDGLDGKADHVLVDFHAEATSEKVAMGWYLDGRVTAVLGTHTHVPDRRRARAPRRDRLHERRRHDRPARRRHRRQEGAGDPVARRPDGRALRDLRGRPVAHGRAHPLRGRPRRAAAIEPVRRPWR